MYHPFPVYKIFLRRAAAITLGALALPVMIFFPYNYRARFYSYLHRYWLQVSDKPAWLEDAERGAQQWEWC